MADNGVRFAAIFVVWHDFDRRTGEPTARIINSKDMVLRATEEILKHDMVPYLCGYPAKGRHVEFADAMDDVSTTDTQGWLLDPEKAMKDRDGSVGKKHSEDLFWECVKRNPYREIGVTSYGLPNIHRTFPWSGFIKTGEFDALAEPDWHSPQLYDQTIANIERGLQEYKELGANIIVPSFGTYKFVHRAERETRRMNCLELKQHLGRFLRLRVQYDIKAMLGWSEAQVRTDAWPAIAEAAEILSD
jgi:hypothetical protein